MIVFFSIFELDEDVGDFFFLGEISFGNMDNFSYRIRVNYKIIIKQDLVIFKIFVKCWSYV